jgi:hypothetical protein
MMTDHSDCAAGQCPACADENVPEKFHRMPDGEVMPDSEMDDEDEEY